MTDPAQAFLNHGNVDQWTRGAGPITGIGTTMGHGSWPIFEDALMALTLEPVVLDGAR